MNLEKLKPWPRSWSWDLYGTTNHFCGTRNFFVGSFSAVLALVNKSSSFNTHLNVFFLLTSAPLQFENRLLNTTMALSSKTKRATRMYILRRYHLPAVAMCAMKISISGRGFLHGDDTQAETQIQLHIEFDSDSNAESSLISTKTWTYLLRNRTPYSKKTEGANFEKPPAFKGGNRKST